VFGGLLVVAGILLPVAQYARFDLGRVRGSARQVEAGLQGALLGVALFVVLGAFFEGAVHVSGLYLGAAGQVAVAVALIIVGLVLVATRVRPRRAARRASAAPRNLAARRFQLEDAPDVWPDFAQDKALRLSAIVKFARCLHNSWRQFRTRTGTSPCSRLGGRRLTRGQRCCRRS
jgi:hypothetical protein